MPGTELLQSRTLHQSGSILRQQLRSVPASLSRGPFQGCSSLCGTTDAVVLYSICRAVVRSAHACIQSTWMRPMAGAMPGGPARCGEKLKRALGASGRRTGALSISYMVGLGFCGRTKTRTRRIACLGGVAPCVAPIPVVIVLDVSAYPKHKITCVLDQLMRSQDGIRSIVHTRQAQISRHRKSVDPAYR
jgi:hypothetical protein